MKQRKVLIGIAAVSALVAIPVAITQLTRPEGRAFTGPALDNSRYGEVEFRNEAQEIDLAGMLFEPEGEGPFPAVVVIHGSGNSRRANAWYLSVAHYLQDHGVIVLLPDKRGSEKSKGDWRTASFEDLATDTLAAIRFLQDRRLEISEIGVIGMSQGGWIAPIVAQRSTDVSFLVSVVGAAVTTHRQLVYEENRNLRQMGFLPGISSIVAVMSTRWIRHVAQKEFWNAIGNFDPVPYWSALDIRALALYGKDDSNVPSAESAEILRSLENPNISVRIFLKSGHPLQDPAGQGNRIFREDALRDIREFIDG